MGFFSKIKDVGKKILGGVKKVFKKVGRAVSKVLDSDIGKAILTTAAVVTGGIALAAGATKFAGATGFFNKFVAGGKEFVSALANPVSKGKELLGGAGTTAQQVAAGSQAGTGVGAAGGAAGEQAAQAMLASPQTGATAQAANLAGGTAGATGGAATQTKGFLGRVAELGGKAAGKTYDLLKTPGGGYLATGLVRGYAEGKMMEDQRNWADRFNRMWDDPDQVAPLQEAASRDIGVPTGYLSNMRDSADFQMQGGTLPYQRRVTFTPGG